MAETVGIFDAKTRFSEIVERVQSTGQPITVTNRGRPAVEIVPCHAKSSRRMSRVDAVREIARSRCVPAGRKPAWHRSTSTSDRGGC